MDVFSRAREDDKNSRTSDSSGCAKSGTIDCGDYRPGDSVIEVTAVTEVASPAAQGMGCS
jgi:hypothetical protein